MGIKSGAGSVTFGKDGAFSTQMGNYKLSGTYTFDPSTHVAAMKFAKEKLGKEKLDLGEVPGHVSLSGTKMILVFPVSKLIEIIKSYGSKSRRWRLSSPCSNSTRTYTSDSNSARKREKMRNS